MRINLRERTANTTKNTIVGFATQFIQIISRKDNNIHINVVMIKLEDSEKTQF